jgi:thiamine-phosphate pyrophosphorylase
LITDHQASPTSVAGEGLPRLIVVADVDTAPRPLPEIVAGAAEHGARGFLLRARTLPASDRSALAAALRAVLPDDALLIVTGGTGSAIHLSAHEQFPQPRPSLVGRSCHDAAEVDQAVVEGCDYIFVSPVFVTASKPGYGPALGPNGLAGLCRPALPVYALGGVLPDRVAPCRAAGAYGVAVMGPVLHDPPIVAAYCAALEEVER